MQYKLANGIDNSPFTNFGRSYLPNSCIPLHFVIRSVVMLVKILKVKANLKF